MTHVNRQARDAVEAALVASTSLDSVSTNRQTDLEDLELPAAIVLTGSDVVERFSKGTSVSGPTELRTIELGVAVVLYGDSETVDDEADALRVQIEPLIGSALAGLVRVARHTGSELDVLQAEDGESWYAVLLLMWEVEIVTPVGDPETAII